MSVTATVTPLSSSWFSNGLFVVSLSILTAYIVLRVIYQLFFSSLSVIPGPWYAAVSDLWLTSHVMRLEACTTIQNLFDTYGPVVRVGPNKVVFRELNSMKNIYSVQKWDKFSSYKALVTNDNDHAMTTLDHSRHVLRRKAYAGHYNPNNLVHFQNHFHESTVELLQVLDGFAGKSSLETLTCFRHFMVDVIIASSYGHRFNALSKWAANIEEPLTNALGDFPKRGIAYGSIPRWLWNLVSRIPHQRWRKLCDSDKILAEYATSKVYEMRGQIKAGKIGDSRKPMLARLLEFGYGAEGPMPDLDIISETMGHMVAGADTTSISLAYFFWELSRRADIVKRLRSELDQAMPDRRSIPDISVLQKLPYLSAFIKEGLRVYGAAPSLLQRVVPATTKSGATNESYDLLGYALPPGTVVAAQAWTMHRDADVFPSPNTFLPDRWLETWTNEEHLAQMQQYYMPFGTGSRVCGGDKLAMMMLRITVASVVRNFDIQANPKETNERTMDIKDSFIIFPASQECRLSFLPRP